MLKRISYRRDHRDDDNDSAVPRTLPLLNPCLCPATPTGHSSSVKYVTPLSDTDDNDSNNDNTAFSLVEWIDQNLPCGGGAGIEVHLASEEPQSQPLPQSPPARRRPSFDSLWCDLSTITPCPLADAEPEMPPLQPLAVEEEEEPPRPMPVPSSSFQPRPASSSWLTGHLALIPAPQSANHNNNSVGNSISNGASTSSRPPRSKSPPTTAAAATAPPIRRTPSQTLASHLVKLAPSRSNSRSGTPVPNHCQPMHCLAAHSVDGDSSSRHGVDSTSSVSVGLNSNLVADRDGAPIDQHYTARDSQCMAAAPNDFFSCGNGSGSTVGDAPSHSENNNVSNHNNVERTQSKSLHSTSLDTIGHNTHALPTILSSNHNHPNSSLAAGPSNNNDHVVVLNHPTNNNHNNSTTPKVTNTKSIEGSLANDVSIMVSSISGSVSNNNPSSIPYIKSLSSKQRRRSPSPLFFGTQVQLEKLLSRNNLNHHLHLKTTESGTITTTEGGSGVDHVITTNTTTANTTTSKRKGVQWNKMVNSSTSKLLPVRITANEHSTETTVVIRDIRKMNNIHSSSSSIENIGMFATHHEEIVTALIDGALKKSAEGEQEQGIIMMDASQTATAESPSLEQPPSSSNAANVNGNTSSPKRPLLTPIRKIRRNSNSPHRSSLSTPLWKRNNRSLLLSSHHKSEKIKSDRRGSDATTTDSEKGLFHFKKPAFTTTSTTTCTTSTSEKKPLHYFHPQCRLLKEKGSEKRKEMVASAVGKEAVLEKLQVRILFCASFEYLLLCFLLIF